VSGSGSGRRCDGSSPLAERARDPVDRRQEAEVVAAHAVAQDDGGGRARRRCDPHPEVVARADEVSTRAASPRAAASAPTISRASSRRRSLGAGVGGCRSVVTGTTIVAHELTAAPALGHVLVLDPLLEQHDAFEQGLGPGRAAGHVDVDRDDLVDALGDRVAVPVGAAAVGARTHGDHVLGSGICS
jgi:hypothetical protein